MGTVNATTDWVVLAYRDRATGEWYALDLDPATVSVGTDFNRPNGEQLATILEPAGKPLTTVHVAAAPAKEVRKCVSHQQCIDRVQTMLQGRRP